MVSTERTVGRKLPRTSIPPVTAPLYPQMGLPDARHPCRERDAHWRSDCRQRCSNPKRSRRRHWVRHGFYPDKYPHGGTAGHPDRERHNRAGSDRQYYACHPPEYREVQNPAGISRA